MIYTIPLDAVPNQTVSTTINGKQYRITLETRLDQLYATIEDNAGLIIANRICLASAPITRNFVFIDLDGSQDPIYSDIGPNGCFKLVWRNE
ncbi:phage baseplate plug family protein [Acinetobacter larvae]|uniref:Cyanophage baseplate Pam3 plug gp18 domain-containing protein n=1 Tax=Acinetobacter larvae TaxID=1789224 RepID=A0A1B2LZH0_9GAMM|nr:hypothetical protein [Acinetobacter larvae]AOA58335.1 hypothetical protein BFG52_08190 [Acinetobacter larvae]